MAVKFPVLMAIVICASAILLASCETLQHLLAPHPSEAVDLLREVDAAITAFENAALLDPTDPIATVAFIAIQAARRALIARILACLANDYPAIDTTALRDRFMALEEPPPLVE